MELLEFPGWLIEYDRLATAAAYAAAPADRAAECVCGPCRNWVATRICILPVEFRTLLNRLGIPIDGEAEVYHNGRLESGLHSYCGWYHFVGNVLVGEQECSPNVVFGAVSVYFASGGALLRESFSGLPIVQLEFESEMPWLSDVPESI